MTGPAASLVPEGAVYAATALVATYIGFLAVLLAIAISRTRQLRARIASSREVRPRLDAALVALLAGGKEDSLFRALIKSHATDIAESILLFQTTVGGSARERLCQLALDLGLVQQWCLTGRSPDVIERRVAFSNLAFACVYEPCRKAAGDLIELALEDPDEEVRLAACRGLVLTGGEHEVERLFVLATGPSLLTRIVLAEDLRRYAIPLSAGLVQVALRSGEALQIRATLELLAAWERAIPLPDLREFLEHRDRDIRSLAFRMAALVSIDYESRLAMVRSLSDPDALIRRLAIIAVGRQKMTEAIPELAMCLRREGLEEARRAADALASMPPQGWIALEELSLSTNPATALAAGEALARVRQGA